MKLFILHVFLLLLTSARSAFAGVIPDSDFGRRESKEGEIDAMDENMALDARAAQLPVVPIVIAALAIGNIVLGQTLHTLKTKGAAEVRPPSNDKESASELLQKSVNWVSQNSDFSAVAIRGGVSTSVGFDGDFGKDWQSSVVTIDAAEGQSQWVFYWARRGSIVVATSSPSRDIVAASGTTTLNRNSENNWTVTLSH